jgi:integrase/recombinase XerD
MTARPSDSPPLSALLRDFFLDRLTRERGVSRCTVCSYRDTFQLLLPFVARQQRRSPERLQLADLDGPTVLRFLEYLERDRGNCTATRNVRLAAIRSFMHFAAYRTAANLPTIRQVLALPSKRCARRVVDCLSRTEVKALLAAVDTSRWSGQRDGIMLQTLYNTGARVSEVIALCVGDVDLGPPAQVHIHGKGRKERIVPPWPQTRTGLRRWLRLIDARPDRPLFPDRVGNHLSRSGVAARLKGLATQAASSCPTLKRHRVSPHLVRHYVGSGTM